MSRASSQDERAVGTGTPLTAEAFKQVMLQMQQHLIIQQQQFLRDLVERINPAGREAPRGEIEEDHQEVAQAEELLMGPPARADLVERVSPITVNSQRFASKRQRDQIVSYTDSGIRRYGIRQRQRLG